MLQISASREGSKERKKESTEQQGDGRKWEVEEKTGKIRRDKEQFSSSLFILPLSPGIQVYPPLHSDFNTFSEKCDFSKRAIRK